MEVGIYFWLFTRLLPLALPLLYLNYWGPKVPELALVHLGPVLLVLGFSLPKQGENLSNTNLVERGKFFKGFGEIIHRNCF